MVHLSLISASLRSKMTKDQFIEEQLRSQCAETKNYSKQENYSTPGSHEEYYKFDKSSCEVWYL